ncbi:organic cation transporter 1-like [Battus philenor]|uniref:organic cation transporter 1-like n=1 Tax=Battus philenor TaxID=42288 RepID=UPI0035D13990
MTSWTRELDEAAVLATSKGYWHVILFYLLCGLAAIPTSFLVFAQVFTNATPDHWCAPPPELEGLGIPDAVLRNLTVPSRETCTTYVFDSPKLLDLLKDEHERPSMQAGGNGLCSTLFNKLNKVDCPFNNIKVFRATIHLEEGVSESRTHLCEEQIERIIQMISLVRNKSTGCPYGWKYSKEQYINTLVTEYSLVCEKEWLSQFSYTLFWVGSIFGNLIFGWLSDRYGRRFTILFMIYLEVPLAIAAAFPNSYTTYIVLRLIGGLFFPALYQQPFILALELMPPARRTNAGIVVGMLFASGISLLALIAYAIRDWFQLSLATSVPFILLYGYYWLIPESPRWLVGKGRFHQAEEVLIALAKKNGIDLSPGFLLDIHRELERDNTIDEKVAMLSFDENNVPLRKDVEKDIVDHRINNMLTFKPDIIRITDNEREIGIRLINNKDPPTNILKDESLLTDDERAYIEEINSPESVHRLRSKSDSSIGNINKSIKTKSIEVITNIFSKNEETDDSENRIIESLKSEEDCEASILDIFRYPNIRKKFLISTLDWISLGVIYNSLSYNTSNLGVNDHIAFFIGGVVEIPSYVLAWRCMERFGRRWVLCIFMIVGGILCLSCGLVPEDLPWVTVALAMCGKLCAAAAFAVFYVMVGELLPTVLRAQAIGLSSFITGLGLLACPYIAHLAVYGKALPLITMGVLSIVAGIAPLYLPETLNEPLPQTLDDGEMFGRDTKILSCVKTK